MLGMALAASCWSRLADAAVPISPMRPGRLPSRAAVPPRRGSPPRRFPGALDEVPASHGDAPGTARSARPQQVYYHPAGMHLEERELARAKQVNAAYTAAASDPKVARSVGSVVASSELVGDAEQLMARVIHRAIERALEKAAPAARAEFAAADPQALRTSVIQSLQESQSAGLNAAGGGVWARVLERDFGDITFTVKTQEAHWAKFWEQSTRIAVDSPELPSATAKLDHDALAKALKA